MGAMRQGFGESITPPKLVGAGATPSTNITGLSSRQVVFGSPSGGVAQSPNIQIDSTEGYLGIGTTNPGSPLELRTTSINAFRLSNQFSGTSQALFLFQFGATAGNAAAILQHSVDAGSAVGNIALNPSGGLVGIGTTAPQLPFHVNGSSASIRISSTATTHAYVEFMSGAFSDIVGIAGGANQISNGAAAGDLVFRTAAANKMLWSVDGGNRAGLTLTTLGVNVLSTANGNAFQVQANSGLGVVFNIKSTGTTSKLGFWTTAGTTKSTVTTAVAAVGVTEFNRLIDVLRGYGLVG